MPSLKEGILIKHLFSKFELLVFRLLSLKVGQKPDLPKSKNFIYLI
jgi:hypothetical protein